MGRTVHWMLLAALASTCSLGAAPPKAAPTDANISAAVAGVTGYQSGRDPNPLEAVRVLVRRVHGHAKAKAALGRALARLLADPKATHEAKLFACKQLWILGGQQATRELKAMLTDAKQCHLACYVLAWDPRPAAGALLRQAARDAKGPALLCLLNALGDRRESESLDLYRRYVSDEDPTLSEAAMAALGKLPAPRAADALAKARESAPANRRVRLGQALLACAQRLTHTGQGEAAAAICVGLLAESEPSRLRRGALLGLMAASPEQATPRVLALLRSEDRVLRLAATTALRTNRSNALTDRLASELPHLTPAVQVALIDELAERSGPTARKALEQAVEYKDQTVRLAALAALGPAGTVQSVPVLVRAMAGGQAEQRAAAFSLRHLRGRGVNDAIQAALAGAGESAGAELIRILQDRGATASASALLAVAKTASPAVRKAALRALGKLGQASHLAPLLALVGGRYEDTVAREAQRAAIQVARRNGQAKVVLASLAKAKQPGVRAGLLRVLGGLGGTPALAAVRNALTDTDLTVRDAAVRALASWPDAAALELLAETFAGADSSAHRAVALRGAVRLLQSDQTHGARHVAIARALAGQVKSPAEKRLLLSALSAMRHPDVPAVIALLASDQAVQAEAELASLAVARGLIGLQSPAVRDALARLARTAHSEQVRKKAGVLAGRAGKLAGYLTAWQVCGPFTQPGRSHGQLLGLPFPPENPDAPGGESLVWRPLPAATSDDQPWMMDLAAALGECPSHVAFVRTFLVADADRTVHLSFGTDDGNMVFLNGVRLRAYVAPGAAKPGEHELPLRLRKGTNVLMLKIAQISGTWQFCAQLTDGKGRAVKGIHSTFLPAR